MHVVPLLIPFWVHCCSILGSILDPVFFRNRSKWGEGVKPLHSFLIFMFFYLLGVPPGPDLVNFGLIFDWFGSRFEWISAPTSNRETATTKHTTKAKPQNSTTAIHPSFHAHNLSRSSASGTWLAEGLVGSREAIRIIKIHTKWLSSPLWLRCLCIHRNNMFLLIVACWRAFAVFCFYVICAYWFSCMLRVHCFCLRDLGKVITFLQVSLPDFTTLAIFIFSHLCVNMTWCVDSFLQ